MRLKFLENATRICQAHLWQLPEAKVPNFIITVLFSTMLFMELFGKCFVWGIHSFTTLFTALLVLCCSAFHPFTLFFYKMETLMSRTLSNFTRFLRQRPKACFGISHRVWTALGWCMCSDTLGFHLLCSQESTELLHFPLALCFFIFVNRHFFKFKH